MPILAGERVTAARLNRLQPKTYSVTSNALLSGSVTDSDVPGASISLTTETDNAVYLATAAADLDLSGATTNLGRCKLSVDSSIQSPEALFQAAAATDRVTASQQWRGTLGSAGSHTLKLVATLPASMDLRNIHTGLIVVIYEVV
jgi:hypothetical protein